MRVRTQDWFSFHSEQYNTFDTPHRLFFMRGKIKGLVVPGYHAFKDGIATMQIKLFAMFPVVNNKGKEMNIGETVTVFNDMCILAPASLIDARIHGKESIVNLKSNLYEPGHHRFPLCLLLTTRALSNFGLRYSMNSRKTWPNSVFHR